MDRDSFARSITLQTGVDVTPAQIALLTTGYAVEGLRDRATALAIAAVALDAFAADPEAGLPTVQVAGYTIGHAAGTFGVIVRTASR